MNSAIDEKLNKLSKDIERAVEKRPELFNRYVEALDYCISQIDSFVKEGDLGGVLTPDEAAVKIAIKAEQLSTIVNQNSFLIRVKTLLEIPRLTSQTIPAAVNLMRGENQEHKFIKAKMQSSDTVLVKFKQKK